MTKTVKITLTFDITDEAKITELANEAIEQYGMGFDPDEQTPYAPLAARVAEYLLHSNPDVCPGGYEEYGISLVATGLEEDEWETVCSLEDA